MFLVLLTNLVNVSSHTLSVALSNQKCEIQPTLIKLLPNGYSQELHYCNDLSNKVCVPNQTEDLNLNTFSMITWINESKILTKHISCECESKLDTRKCNSNQKWNSDKCWWECKNSKEHHLCEEDYI